MAETKTEWYFIVNPRAGSGKTMSKWIPAERKLALLGVPYTVSYTDHKKHAIDLAHDAAAAGYRKIMAVGGDGSAHEVLYGIVKYCNWSGTDTSEFYMGVLPIGSGNDWIKCLDVPNDTGRVVELLASGSFRQMDIIQAICSGGKMSTMLNCAGIGLDSHVCKRVNIQKEGGKRGKLIYFNAMLSAISIYSPINVKIMGDGEEVFCGDILTIAMGNGKYSGSGMVQVPLALNDDGIIDMMVVPAQPVAPLATDVIPKLFNGKIVESGKIVYSRCRTFEIAPMDESSDDIVELDGEIIGRLPMIISGDGRKINVIHG